MSSCFSVGQVWLHRDGSVMLVLTEPARAADFGYFFRVLWLHRDSIERPELLNDQSPFARGFKKRIL